MIAHKDKKHKGYPPSGTGKEEISSLYFFRAFVDRIELFHYNLSVEDSPRFLSCPEKRKASGAEKSAAFSMRAFYAGYNTSRR